MADRHIFSGSGLTGTRLIPADVSRSWAIITRLTQIRIMLVLWVTAALLDLIISMTFNWTWATPLRIGATYTCGFCLSLAGYRFASRGSSSLSEFSIIRMLAVVIPSGALLFAVDVIGRAYAHGESPFVTWPDMYVRRTRVNLAYFTMMFAFQFTIAWLSTSARALELRERQLLEARLSALRLQLNPHFLFNTLNAILTFVEEAGAKEAGLMLTRLSDFLQVSLDGDPAVMVPLATEIDMVQAYLDIEAVRFGDRLGIEYRCDAGLEDASVPNFILQPLVENAVKHAVARSSGRVTISIRAAAMGDRLVLSVIDDAPSLGAIGQVHGNGVGLRNVASRLEAIFGDAADLETQRSDTGFSATVRLPLERPDYTPRAVAEKRGSPTSRSRSESRRRTPPSAASTW